MFQVEAFAGLGPGDQRIALGGRCPEGKRPLAPAGSELASRPSPRHEGDRILSAA